MFLPGLVHCSVGVRRCYPEDLAFYRREGGLAFATVSHEGMAWAVDLDFGYTLPKQWDLTPHEMALIGDGGFE
jgi:hypothetical protein